MTNSWTSEEEKILLENAHDHTNKQLQQMLLNIGSSRTISSIQNRKVRLGVRCSFNAGCFKKGQTPKNKGKKWSEYMSEEGQANSRKTTFKKGNIPPNRSEIGKERITVDGYTEIKIQDKKGNKNWIPKHRYIYEQYYGKIPDGYVVMFADRNKQNFDIDNLILVSRHEDLIMNSKKLLYNDKELTKSGHLVAKIISKERELRKDIKNV